MAAVTAEMFLLFTFVLFGGSLIWSGFTVISVPTLLFTAIASDTNAGVSPLAAGFRRTPARPSANRVVRAERTEFLLLILLPVFAGVPGSDQLFAVCSLVVLVSVVVHGGSPMFWRIGAQARVAGGAGYQRAAGLY